MKETLRAVLKRVPMARTLSKYLRGLSRSSAHAPSVCMEIRGGEFASEAARLRGAWLSQEVPARQRHLVEDQLAGFRRGARVDVFDVMVKALRDLPETTEGMSVLEIGCSSGYYAEVLRIAGIDLTYTGCDYSAAFVSLAREKYPHLRFDVEDATVLRYADSAFDIVVSGSCLLHIPEYAQAVAETARVARRYAIFHRTPVVLGQPEKRFRKLLLLAQHGLALIATYTWFETVSSGVGSAQRTYVCKKVAS
jgi:SAM-dependent methyltransferase